MMTKSLRPLSTNWLIIIHRLKVGLKLLSVKFTVSVTSPLMQHPTPLFN